MVLSFSLILSSRNHHATYRYPYLFVRLNSFGYGLTLGEGEKLQLTYSVLLEIRIFCFALW